MIRNSYSEDSYSHLLKGIDVDVSGHWTKWDWKKTGHVTGYKHARLEEYRDSVIVAYRLYNRIGLEHIRRILRNSSYDVRILDAGGGTGRKSIPLAVEGYKKITLLDHAPEWIRLAGEKALDMGVSDRISMIEGDVCNMHELEDASFDYVFAMGGVVSYCGNPGKAVGEMSRVLKKGGILMADGIHGRLGSMHLLARMGKLDELERGVEALMPEDLEAMTQGLRAQVWSEFMFLPDDSIRIGEDTERWEKAVTELEMKYYDNPMYLGAGMLILYGEKT